MAAQSRGRAGDRRRGAQTTTDAVGRAALGARRRCRVRRCLDEDAESERKTAAAARCTHLASYAAEKEKMMRSWAYLDKMNWAESEFVSIYVGLFVLS